MGLILQCSIALMMLVLAPFAPAFGQTGGANKWVLVAVRNLPGDLRKDSIEIATTPNRYRAVRFTARRGGIRLTRVLLVHQSGSTFLEDRTIVLANGERTRPIGPPSSKLAIQRVSFLYEPVASDKASKDFVMEVWGLVGPPAPNLEKEILIGTKMLGFGVDREVIQIGPELGRMNEISVRAKEQNVFVRDAKIYYSDKPTANITINAELKPNNKYSLTPSGNVTGIEIVHKSIPQFGTQARLEIYGRTSEEKPPADCVASDTCTPVYVFFGRRPQSDLNSQPTAATHSSWVAQQSPCHAPFARRAKFRAPLGGIF